MGHSFFLTSIHVLLTYDHLATVWKVGVEVVARVDVSEEGNCG